MSEDKETAATPGRARDLQGEEATREFTGWAEAQGYDDSELYSFAEMDEAFAAGMQAQRDLGAVASHERAIAAARIELARGNPHAARLLLDEQLDGYDGLPWNGTDTGLEWLAKARGHARVNDPD